MTISSCMILAQSKPRSLTSKEDRKANGIHYTPPMLAQYLAGQLVMQYLAGKPIPDVLTILDPACGDGELLLALILSLPPAMRSRTHVIGYDTNETAVAETVYRLTENGVLSTDIRCADFLSTVSGHRDHAQLRLSFHDHTDSVEEPRNVDLIISNPPYVRTQVLGAVQARSLSRKFNLSGRVDLYHAFVVAMTKVLRVGGVMGLLTSNRFISTQAGTALREWFMREFNLNQLIDLGDTKLFEAAVLPAIVIAEKAETIGDCSSCRFSRIYELSGTEIATKTCASVLDSLSQKHTGTIAIDNRRFKLEIGMLRTGDNQSVPWILTSDKTEKWIESVSKRSAGTFSDVGKVCVGIKTTADKVFIRDDWASLPCEIRPEEELLRSLITHHVAKRWAITTPQVPGRQVLYPYLETDGRRQPVALHDFPRAARYLESHRERLEQRRYLVESGRNWYEIWVPHTPSAWRQPKIAFPDISSKNTFFMAESGWVINGDCYWITLKPSAPLHLLYTMLAVANSSFIVQYYDTMFHNKLYAGRRRFMSQYVENFPIPAAPFSHAISDVTKKLLDAIAAGNSAHTHALEKEADTLVWESFGLVEEV